MNNCFVEYKSFTSLLIAVKKQQQHYSTISANIGLTDYHSFEQTYRGYINSIRHLEVNKNILSDYSLFNKSVLNNIQILRFKANQNLKKIEESFYKSEFHSLNPRLINRLKNLELKDLTRLYNRIRLSKKHLELKMFLKFLITKKEASSWFVGLIKRIDKVLASISSKKLPKSTINKRFFYRKLCAFLFKNLDDYHGLSIL